MTPIAKLPLKPTSVMSITSNFSFAKRSNSYQNLVPVDTTNLAKQLDSAFDNSEKPILLL